MPNFKKWRVGEKLWRKAEKDLLHLPGAHPCAHSRGPPGLRGRMGLAKLCPPPDAGYPGVPGGCCCHTCSLCTLGTQWSMAVCSPYPHLTLCWRLQQGQEDKEKTWDVAILTKNLRCYLWNYNLEHGKELQFHRNLLDAHSITWTLQWWIHDPVLNLIFSPLTTWKISTHLLQFLVENIR